MGIRNYFVGGLKDGWDRQLRSLRIGGVLLGAFFVILGLICVLMPFQSAAFVETLIAVFVLILGVYHLAQYASTPVLLRRGGALLAAIFNVFLGIFLLTTPDESMMGFFATIIAVALLFAGLLDLFIAGQLRILRARGYSWTLAKGVLMILAAMMFSVLPVSSTVTVSVFVGLYLLTSGASLLVECLGIKDGAETNGHSKGSGQRGRKKLDEIEEGEIVEKK